MKFDIVRAWKDESYRRSLSNEQREMLPANPAGELTDAEMERVYGGGGGGGAPMVTPAAPVAPVAPVIHHVYHHSVGVVSTAASAASSTHIHSFALLCDVSVFSLNAVQIPIIPIASPFSQCCAECD